MRIISTFFSLLFLFSYVNAQNTLEQLQVKLASIDDLNERYHVKLDFAYKTKSQSFEESHASITTLLHQFEDGNNKELLAKAQCYYGGLLLMTDSNTKAQEYLFKSLSYYKTVDNHKQLSRIYNNLGVSFSNQLAFVKALKYQKECISIRAKNNEPLHSNYVNVGTVYYALNQYSEAISYFKLAESFYEKSSNKYTLASIYTDLSICYNELGDYETALNYGLAAVELSAKHKNKRLTTLSHCNLGSVYLTKKKYEQAIHYYEIAVQEAKATDHAFHQMIAFNSLGHIYTNLDSLELAEAYLLKANTLISKANVVEEEILNYQALSTLYQKSNKLEEALLYFNKYVKVTDSLKQVNLNKELPEMLMENKQSIEASIDYQSHLLQQKSHNTLLSLFIIFGTEALLVLLFLGIRFTNLFKNQKTKDISDVMLAHFTLGCIISVLGYWFYPKEAMHQGPLILTGILIGSITSTLILLRKINYKNVGN